MGDADIRAALTMAANRHWGDLGALLEASPDRWLITQVLVGPEGMPVDLFEEWARADLDGPGVGLLAMASVNHSWRRRLVTDGTVPMSDGEFRDSIENAEVLLLSAADREPDSPEPWVYLLAAARALGNGRQVLRDRYEQAHERHPFHPGACNQFLLGEAGLWANRGESPQAMYTFVAWVDEHAPPSSPARLVVPRLHLEMGYRSAGSESATEYLRRADVARVLADGLGRYLGAIGGMAETRHLPVLNHYALTLTPTDRESAELVDECFQCIGERVTAAPWNLFGDVRDRFDQVRTHRLADASAYLGGPMGDGN